MCDPHQQWSALDVSQGCMCNRLDQIDAGWSRGSGDRLEIANRPLVSKGPAYIKSRESVVVWNILCVQQHRLTTRLARTQQQCRGSGVALTPHTTVIWKPTRCVQVQEHNGRFWPSQHGMSSHGIAH